MAQIHTQLSSRSIREMWDVMKSFALNDLQCTHSQSHKHIHTKPRHWDCDICLTICWGRIVFGARDTHYSLRMLQRFFFTARYFCVSNSELVMRIRKHTNDFNMNGYFHVWKLNKHVHCNQKKPMHSIVSLEIYLAPVFFRFLSMNFVIFD